MDNDILWTPSDERKQSSALWAFANRTTPHHGAKPDDYARLHSWSIREPEAFYHALWDEFGIIGDHGWGGGVDIKYFFHRYFGVKRLQAHFSRDGVITVSCSVRAP